MNKNKKKLKIMIMILSFVALIFACLGICSYFQCEKYKDIFIKNVYINDVDVSCLTIEQAYDKLTSENDKSIHIFDDIAKLDLSMNEISTINLDKNEISNIFKKTNTMKNKILGVDNITFNIEESITINSNKLLSLSKDFINDKSRKDGENAKIVFEDNDFVIQENVIGTIIDEEKFLKELETFIKDNYSLDNQDVLVMECLNYDVYKLPAINEKDLIDILDIYKKSVSYEFNMNFYGNIEPINSKILYNWAKLDENELPILDENNNLIYDRDKVYQSMIELSNKYSTYGKNYTFINHNQEEITIESPNFGWLMNVDDTTDLVMEHLKSKDINELEVIFDKEGLKGVSLDDNYIEVDIDEQHIYFYKDGLLVLDSDVVTGNYTTNDTNKGIFKLLYKTKNATLRGRGYATPVSYWMPFNSDGEGFHDASWRKSFGEEIYKGNGSHGCVNMPIDKAKELYNLIDEDTIILIY